MGGVRILPPQFSLRNISLVNKILGIILKYHNIKKTLT